MLVHGVTVKPPFGVSLGNNGLEHKTEENLKLKKFNRDY
jgi:hypothetical protein